ncbi:MAG TPA: 3-oxoacyl-ACP reductase family protein [Candidatus Omnitrophota bacterium]|nr:3-oxoacyl-ACP reductase family protein [Candidatus Omnitrophota bacterium]HRZ14790.1 3-oxoacyl-ACP reductase family protein [Candidatus Omnitrophota bacterium]
MTLKGKTAIISGATRGIGKAIALELARQGAKISFNYLKSVNEALDLEKEIAALGSCAKAFQSDIKDFGAVADWVNKSKETFGGLDIVINNAGIIRDKALAMMAPEDWLEVINTNLIGTINLSRAAIMTLLKQKSGQIVNISSVTGVVGMPRQTNYAASKAGIIGFTKALAKEVAAYGIRVNAVAPGFIETDMVGQLKDDLRAKLNAKIPLGRFGKPEEVAKAVQFLISERAGYITGQVIVMDGGLSIS